MTTDAVSQIEKVRAAYAEAARLKDEAESAWEASEKAREAYATAQRKARALSDELLVACGAPEWG